MAGLVEEGSRIVLDVNGDRHMFITVKGKNKVKLGKAFCSVQPLIGLPYGATVGVAVDGRTLQQIPPALIADWQEGAALEVTRNNMNLVDLGEANQQMTTEKIEQLRRTGADGTVIVEALASQSVTFDTKTEFSQAKYKKKKARKYVVSAVVRRPTAAVIAEAYYSRQAARIGHLRADTLSLLLSLADVAAHARVLVVDGCGGLVLGAAAERLGGAGEVADVWFGADTPSREALSQFADPGVQAVVRRRRLSHLLECVRSAAPTAAAMVSGGDAAALNAAVEPVLASKSAAGADQGALDAEAMVVDVEPRSVDAAATEPRSVNGTEANDACAGTGTEPSSTPPMHVSTDEEQTRRATFDSCIIAAPGLDPGAALTAVLPLLAPSTPFAVYSPWAGALACALAELRSSRAAVNLALQESWWRSAQVLPGRTHPTMSMDHGGGFVLSGTVVLP